jgi:hypothetical protein
MTSCGAVYEGRAKQVLWLAKERQGVTLIEVADHLRCTQRQAKAQLAQMLAERSLVRIGSGSTMRYIPPEVVEEAEEAANRDFLKIKRGHRPVEQLIFEKPIGAVNSVFELALVCRLVEVRA